MSKKTGEEESDEGEIKIDSAKANEVNNNKINLNKIAPIPVGDKNKNDEIMMQEKNKAQHEYAYQQIQSNNENEVTPDYPKFSRDEHEIGSSGKKANRNDKRNDTYVQILQKDYENKESGYNYQPGNNLITEGNDMDVTGYKSDRPYEEPIEMSPNHNNKNKLPPISMPLRSSTIGVREVEPFKLNKWDGNRNGTNEYEKINNHHD